MCSTNSRPIHQQELSIGKKDQLCQVDFRYFTRRKLLLEQMYCVKSILLFSDGASGHKGEGTDLILEVTLSHLTLLWWYFELLDDT